MKDPAQALDDIQKRLAATKPRFARGGSVKKSHEVIIPLRRILRPKRKPNGDFIQPKEVGPDREAEESSNRTRYAHHLNFADPYTGNTRTFDPKGNYNCGKCNQADGTVCLLVDIPKIDLAAGSCEDWENQCSGDSEMYLRRKSAEAAVYGVALNGKGFGCHRCGHAERAHQPDSVGRELYCMDGDFRTFGTACCARNSAPER
jgi:hypothetical protein